MKRKSPIKHKVSTYKKSNGTVVHTYPRGSREIKQKLSNPSIHLPITTLAEFNKKVKNGTIPIEKVKMYRFWYKGGSFQDFPARTLEEAKIIFKNDKYAGSNPISITSSEFMTQQYRAYLESERQIPLKNDFSNQNEFKLQYEQNKKKRGITKKYQEEECPDCCGEGKIDGEPCNRCRGSGEDPDKNEVFWLFKGKEYNNVGIPKEEYLKAKAKRKKELGF